MNPKQLFMQKMGGVTTPATLPRQLVTPALPGKVAQTTAPLPKRGPAVMTKQVSDVQQALARVKASQQTYGVPGAK